MTLALQDVCITYNLTIFKEILTNFLLNNALFLFLFLLNKNRRSTYILFLVLMFTFFKQKGVFVPGLSNQMFAIHPIIILVVYTTSVSSKYIKNSTYIVVLATAGLIFGGFWAAQENNWGGWWNWDFVETPIFMYTLIYLYITHLKINVNYKNNLKLVFLAVGFILILRLLPNSSIHSFISSNLKSKFIIYLLCVIVFLAPFFTKKWCPLLFVLFKLNLKNFFFIKLLGLFILFFFFKSLKLLKYFSKFFIKHKIILVVLCFNFFLIFFKKIDIYISAKSIKKMQSFNLNMKCSGDFFFKKSVFFKKYDYDCIYTFFLKKKQLLIN